MVGAPEIAHTRHAGMQSDPGADGWGFRPLFEDPQAFSEGKRGPQRALFGVRLFHQCFPYREESVAENPQHGSVGFVDAADGDVVVVVEQGDELVGDPCAVRCARSR